jgi:catalase
MAAEPTARDFVSDAHAHCKFIACAPNAAVLLDAAGLIQAMRDGGYLELGGSKESAEAFVAECRALRFWDRETA